MLRRMGIEALWIAEAPIVEDPKPAHPCDFDAIDLFTTRGPRQLSSCWKRRLPDWPLATTTIHLKAFSPRKPRFSRRNYSRTPNDLRAIEDRHVEL